MKIFIALLFDKETRLNIFEYLKEVEKISTSGNFTNINNLHLTLKYICDTDKLQLEEIKRKLSEISYSCFDYTTNNLGFFQKSKSKIIAYLGLNPNRKLNEIYSLVIDKLNELGYDYGDELYTPHITLGRQVSLINNNSLKDIECNQLTILANRISVMESKRINDRLVYAELFNIPLL